MTAIQIKFEGLRSEIKALDKTILQNLLETKSQENFESEFDVCNEYDNKILTILTEIKTTLDCPNPVINVQRSQLKNPIAPLPTFTSKSNECIEKFLKEFELTTSTYNYPDRDRLLLLKQQVSGRAKLLLDSLEIEKQSYQEARDLLLRALDSPSQRKFNVIKRISEIKLSYGTDPFTYIGEMKALMESVKSLKLLVDDFLQFFFWRGLNETFQNQLINICNTSKPNLDQILENFFEASDRYQISVDKFKSRKFKESNTATAVNVSKFFEIKKLVVNFVDRIMRNLVMRCQNVTCIKLQKKKLTKLA